MKAKTGEKYIKNQEAVLVPIIEKLAKSLDDLAETFDEELDFLTDGWHRGDEFEEYNNALNVLNETKQALARAAAQEGKVKP